MYGAWPDGPASFDGFEELELPQAIAAIATRAVLHNLVILNGALLKTDSLLKMTDRPFANSGGAEGTQARDVVPAILQNPDDVALR